MKHSFAIVAIDYFMKLVEAQPMISAGHEGIIRIILHQIVYRLGILKTITIDQGSMFTGIKMVAYMNEGI